MQDKFNEIARHAKVPVLGELIREVGEMLETRITTNQLLLEEVHKDYAALQRLVQDRASLQSKGTDVLLDRVHRMANHIMALENKLDEQMELISMILEKIKVNGS